MALTQYLILRLQWNSPHGMELLLRMGILALIIHHDGLQYLIPNHGFQHSTMKSVTCS
jgi:hypothetical protein